MSMRSALTHDQLRAIASPADRLYIEASPGSGKTTVAASRFAAQRYAARRIDERRAVLAVSFTRAAAGELQSRIMRDWGRETLRAPNRAETLDALIVDLIHDLLKLGLVRWPGGHETLRVRDTWKALVDQEWGDRAFYPVLHNGVVRFVQTRSDRRAQRPIRAQVLSRISEGICTHDEIRTILAACLGENTRREVLAARIADTMRALIVDEVFDANDLDLAVVELVASAGAGITLIGDPWQALYRFRGARPDLVPRLIEQIGMVRLPLSDSFRWRSDEQARLAIELRRGQSVELPRGDASDDLDVVLACEWSHLWDLNACVLPLAFGSAKGNIPEAGATILLDYVTRAALDLRATYIDDALSTLRIIDAEALTGLDARWPEVIDMLRRPGRPALNGAYNALVAVLATETDAQFPAVRANYTKRLGWLRERLVLPTKLVPGLTVHQAKGREWRKVGLALKQVHHEHLRHGLVVDEAVHRQLYVGCTRASEQTLAV